MTNKEHGWIEAEWDDAFANIKHSGVYPSDVHPELEKKLRDLLLKGKIKGYRFKNVNNLTGD